MLSKKIGKTAVIVATALAGVLCVCLLLRSAASRGQEAVRAFPPEKAVESAETTDFLLCGTLPPSAEEQKRQSYDAAAVLLSAGQIEEAAKEFYQAKGYSDAWEKCFEAWGSLVRRKTIAAGSYHSVGLREDGTVLAAGDYSYGQCAVPFWQNITAVAAGSFHTVGLKNDGHVLAVGRNDSGQCDVSGWTDIVAIAAKDRETWGLKADGTILTAGEALIGSNLKEADEALDWRFFEDAPAETAGENLPDQQGLIRVVGDRFSGYLGLREDGTLVSSENIGYGLDEVSTWDSIVDIDCGMWFALGLRKDGTLVTAGRNEEGQRDTLAWVDIRVPADAADRQLSGKPAAAPQRKAPLIPNVKPIHTEAYLQAKNETLETWRQFLHMTRQDSPELPILDWSSEGDYLPGIPKYTARDYLMDSDRDREVDYWSCDLDGNGFEELIIGNDAVYYFDGAQMRYMFKGHPLGERCRLYRYDPETKTFYIKGSSGAVAGSVGVYRFSEDGYAVSPIRSYNYDTEASEPVKNLIGETSVDESAAELAWMMEESGKPWYTLLGLEPDMRPVFEKPAAYRAARDETLKSWHTLARMLRDGDPTLERISAERKGELLPGIPYAAAAALLCQDAKGLLYAETDLDRDGTDELVIVCGTVSVFTPVAAYVFDGQQMKLSELPEMSGRIRNPVFITA